METSQTPVTPIRQAMVNIAGHRVLGVLLEGGHVAASLRMICDLLGLSYPAQMRKIRADRAIQDSLILAVVKTAGGPQETNVIIAEAIPIWLAHIHENKVAPEVRDTLIEFQRVAVQTLRAFFFPEEKTRQQSAPPKEERKQEAPKQNVLPPEPEEEPLFPPLGSEARYLYWGDMYGAHAGLERHLRTIDEYLLTLTKELAQTRQVVSQHAAILSEHLEALLQHKEALVQLREQFRALKARAGDNGDQISALAEQVKQLEAQVSKLVARLEVPNPLTPEHLGEVRGLVQALAHQTGQPASAVERELAAAFGVEAISQLSEATWGEIAAWLRQRLGW